MAVPSPRGVVQQWVEAWNARDPEAVGALAAPDFVRHDANSPDLVGPEAEMDFVKAVVAAFPDLHFTVNHVVAEGDFVADHLTGTGTHQGEFLGVPPTGRAVRFETMETYRVADGRVAEQWVLTDMLGVLQQLGVIPSPGEPTDT
jgi:steroid delta-isomerase-like uncharacterized protein